MSSSFTAIVEAGYAKLWNRATVRPEWLMRVRRAADTIAVNRPRYQAAGNARNVPWWVIGVIHMRESSFDFDAHLLNGDSLRERTKHKPSGLPRWGTPPFTWEEGVRAALEERSLDGSNGWESPQLFSRWRSSTAWDIGPRTKTHHIFGVVQRKASAESIPATATIAVGYGMNRLGVRLH